MAALDFPNAPSTGQYFVAGNGVTYQWNGSFWLPVGGTTALYIGDTPPALPGSGQLWFKSDEARLYVYYNDGNSQQWVPSAPIPGTQVIAPTQLLQTVSFETGALATGTTVIPTDDTIPQITEGDQYMQLAITRVSAASRLVIDVTWFGSNTMTPGQITAALFQDANVNALAAGSVHPPFAQGWGNVRFTHIMPSGATGATTFRVRAGANGAGTTSFNGSGGVRYLGGAMASSIIIQEVM